MNKNLFWVFIVSFAILFYSCQDNSPSNKGKVKLSFIAKVSTDLKSGLVGGLTIQEALIGVEKIEFELLHEDESGDDDIIFPGPFKIDLLSGFSSPLIAISNIEPGIYEEIEFETEKVLTGGKSVFIKGTVTLADQTKCSFEFTTDDDIDFEIENEQGIKIEPDTMSEMFVVFDLTRLFEGIDLSSVEKDDTGVMVFDDEHNSSITEKLKKNLEQIGDLDDDDED